MLMPGLLGCIAMVAEVAAMVAEVAATAAAVAVTVVEVAATAAEVAAMAVAAAAMEPQQRLLPPMAPPHLPTVLIGDCNTQCSNASKHGQLQEATYYQSAAGPVALFGTSSSHLRTRAVRSCTFTLR